MGRLTSDEISDYIQSHSKSLSDNQTTILNNVSDLTWFRQYAKKSKLNLRKITARIKKGIKQGKYNTSNLGEIGGGEKAFKLPKPKKEKGEKKKQAKQPKIKPENKRTYTPKTKQRV